MKGTELMDRIRDEMVAANNDHVTMIGELLTEYLRIHPETEIDEKRTLKGLHKEMWDNARKKQKNREYAYGPREAFDFILNYFGLPHADADYRACMMAMIGQTTVDTPATVMSGGAVSEICEAYARKQETSKLAKAKVRDLFDLDALMEG